MQFSQVIMIATAVFASVAVAGPSYPNLFDKRLHTCADGLTCQGTGSSTCCEIDSCCYECSEGSDSECTPEITERSILVETS